MKRRVTFLSSSDSPFQSDQLEVHSDSVHIQALKGAREERLTFSFEELPQELWLLLKQCHELHIRWASPRPYRSAASLPSRVSPGLHAFFTPGRNSRTELLCPLLRKVFGEELECDSPWSTFISPPVLSDRFASASSLQYYTLLPSLSNLVAYVEAKICPVSDNGCHILASSLLSANYLDIDYDSISHAFVINAFWDQSPSAVGWTELIVKGSARADTVEVGLLTLEPPREPEELTLGGFLTVVGQDLKSSPTLFSFPSRHHPLPANAIFHTSFSDPAGLHPTLRVTFPPLSLKRPPTPVCYLHAYLTLPSSLFADKYQLSDSLFMQSHRLLALRSIAGETDLEAPDWAVRKWGSTILLELLSPGLVNNDNVYEVEIPLHVRYQQPDPSGHADTQLPCPVVFWACRAEEGTKMTVNPFDRVNLGYDGIFGPKTMFYHLSPSLSFDNISRHTGLRGLIEQIRIPTLDMDMGGRGRRIAIVESGTCLVVLVGFLLICWCLIRTKPSTTHRTARKQKRKEV